MLWLQNNIVWVVQLTIDHLYLSIVPVLIGLAISLPLGWLAYRFHRFLPVVVISSSVLYTIPSLAFFVLMPLITGAQILDPINVIIALTVYTVALLVRTVTDGLESVPEEAVQAATGMGYTSFQRLIHVQLPVAVPVIGAGLRVAVVSNVSVVAIAVLIGIPQLGSLFMTGLQLRQFVPVVLGIILATLIAVLLDWIVQLLIRRMTPWSPKGVVTA